MPRFTIKPIDPPSNPIEVYARGPTSALNMVSRHLFKGVVVLREGKYVSSARVENGVWKIFPRKAVEAEECGESA
jgi:hypothetical protein